MGLREQRARGRNVSDPNAANGQSLARLYVLGDSQGTAVGGIYGPIRIASAAAAAAAAADASAFSFSTANHRLSQDTAAKRSRNCSQAQPQLRPESPRRVIKSEGKVKPHLQQSAAATAARVATEARVATATTCTSGEGSLLRSIP